jgi:MinD-like ATPase involved in chromosome partitioning or flagellar assembly
MVDAQLTSGKLLAVWSPAGSPGRTTLACSIAAELTNSGKNVLIVDADTYAPSLDVYLGLNDHPAGLAAACRLISQERFDLSQLRRLSVELQTQSGSLTVMTGLSSSARWPEVSGQQIENLVAIARQHFDFVLLDTAANLEAETGLAQFAVQRNSVARWAVSNCDLVIAVCGSDPVSIARYLEASVSISELKPVGQVLTLVNRLRTSVLGSSAKQQILETLSRLGQIQVSGFIPDDQPAADAAIRGAVPMVLAKRSSQLRQAISLFTKVQILGQRNPLDGRLLKKPMAKLG